MKKLFAILMSFQLILSPVAMAEQATTGVDAYEATGNSSDAGEKQFFNSLMMTGSGVVGSTMIFCRSMQGNDSTGIMRPNTIPTFSHYIFMAAAVVLLIGEIVAATKQKAALAEAEKQLERQTLVENAPTADITQEQKDLQVNSLKAAKLEEEKNRDALKERVTWLGAAEIGYWLAVAGAATEIILYAATKALSVTSATLQKLAVTPPTVAAYVAAYGAEQAVGYWSWGLTCNNTGQNKLAVIGIAAAYGVLTGLTAGAQGAITKGLTTAMAMNMLLGMTNTVGEGVSKAVNSAPGRLAIFTAFAILAEVTRNGYKDRIYQAEENLRAITNAITAWENATVPGAEIPPGAPDPETFDGTTPPPPPGGNKPKPKPLPKFPKLGKCLNAAMQHSGNSCMKPLKFNRALLKFKSKFLNGAANQSLSLSEAMARDDVAGAYGMAGNMGNNAARVKAEALGLVKEANAALVKNGGKAIDFDKAAKAQLAAITADAKKGSGWGGATGTGTKATLDPEEKSTSGEETAGAPAVAAPGAVEQPATDLSLLGTEELATDGAATAEGKPEQSLDDFESSVQDVAKKDDVSIFKLLSNRYILNYTKIFDRKKQPEVVPDKPEKK